MNGSGMISIIFEHEEITDYLMGAAIKTPRNTVTGITG